MGRILPILSIPPSLQVSGAVIQSSELVQQNRIVHAGVRNKKLTARQRPSRWLRRGHLGKLVCLSAVLLSDSWNNLAAKSASPVKPSRGKHVLSSPASALSESSPSAKAALARKKSPPSPRTKSKLNAKTKTKAKTQTLRPTTLVPTTSPSPSPSHSSTTTSFATPVQPRKRHLQSTLAADLAKSSTQTPSDVIEELRQKFQQLNMLRTTAAEALLEDYKKTSEERIMAAERVIDSLRRENEALKTRLEEHTGSTNGNLAAPRTPSRLSDASTLTVERTDLFRPLLELYESLSGLRVTTDLDQERLWHCSLGGRQGGMPSPPFPSLSLFSPVPVEFAFDLAFDEQEGQYRYTPKFPPKSPIASRLPGYLQDEIAFDPDQLQLFFWRALNFLMSVPK